MTDIQIKDGHFYSGPGVKLATRFYLPSKEADHGTGIVMCHGFGGVKEGVLPSLAVLLAKSGYTAMTFDFRGFGGGGGPLGRLVPNEQIEDAANALEFLALQEGIDKDRIGMYGTSFGGGVSALASIMNPRAKALVISVPVTSGSGWLSAMARYYELADLRERAMNAVAKKTLMGEIELVDRSDIMIPDDLTRARYTTKIPMAMETVFHLLNYEPIESAHKVSVPTLMFGVETDKLCPSRQTTDFYARLTVEKQLKMFAKGEHWAVYDEVLPEVAAGTISWFDQYLKVER